MKKQFSAFSLVFFLIVNTQAQSWSRFGGDNINGNEFVGGDGTSTVPLRIKTLTNHPIQFYTHDNRFTNPPTRMVLTTAGQVGIGMAFTPSHKLDVDSGDINVNSGANGYRINGNYVLLNNNYYSSIFVGENAGGSTPSGYENTFVGYNTGVANTTANRNTFIGMNAGYSNTGRWNTFTGYSCGEDNTTGENNAFYGKHCGSNNTTGYRNTYVASHAAADMTTGSDNVMIGFYSGQYQTQGDSNVLVGSASGRSASAFTNLIGNTFLGAASGEDNSTGMRNTFLGFYAGNTSSSNATTNSTAIGYNAKVRGSNQMILGDNNVSVGIGLSDNATGPQNKLEINHGTAGNSGLRFRQLTSATTPTTNPGTGVLSVDASGDVVYVTQNTAPAIGNYCPATPQPLTNYFEVPLNDYNYYFSGQGTAPDASNIGSSVGIGLPCGDPIPLAKLHVLQTVYNPSANNASVAGYFENNSSGAELSASVYGVAHNDAETTIGAKFDAFGNDTDPSQDAIGVYGYASTALDWNVGVAAEGYGGDFNYGVYARADSGSESIAVYGFVPNSTGFGLHYAGSFDGDVHFAGDVLGSQFGWTASDSKFKSNITDIVNSTAILSQLRPKTYLLDTTDKFGMHFSTELQYGFISQEVEQILPSLVKNVRKPATRDLKGNTIYPAVDYKAMNYGALFGIIVAAVQEQQHKIDSLNNLLNSKLAAIENRLNSCCGLGGASYKTDEGNQEQNNVSVELSNVQVIVLEQNVPNPFAEQTSISYHIPTGMGDGQMVFTDMLGNIIKTAEVKNGYGTVTVFAGNLSSGQYSYTLIVNGKTIETKKMVKQR